MFSFQTKIGIRPGFSTDYNFILLVHSVNGHGAFCTDLIVCSSLHKTDVSQFPDILLSISAIIQWGAPQGLILGPLMFVLLVGFLWYGDGAQIYVPTKSNKQTELTMLMNVFRAFSVGLIISVVKCSFSQHRMTV